MKKRSEKTNTKNNNFNKVVRIITFILLIISASFTAYYGYQWYDTVKTEKETLNSAIEKSKTKDFARAPFVAGDIMGLIESEDLNIKTALVFGGESKNEAQLNEIMKKGAALDSLSPNIGDQKQSLIYGHRNQEFMKLEKTVIGTKFFVTTATGKYTYKTVNTEIVDKTDVQKVERYRYNDPSLMPKHEEEEMVLYTCYPFNLAADTERRFLVFTKLESVEK